MLGGKNTQLGYTIVELMVVLAISGAMFVIASTFINGRQQTAAFNNGISDLSSQLQLTGEQVENGQYSDEALKCSASGDAVAFSAASVGSISTQGQNGNSNGTTTTQGSDGCLYLGKLIYFYTTNSSAPTNYITYSLAGRQVNFDTPADFAGEGFTAVYNSSANINLSTESAIQNALQVTAMYVKDINGHVIATTNFGFAEDPLNQNGADSNSLIYSDSGGLTNPTSNPNSDATAITNGTIHQAYAVYLCVTDGSRYASLEIGDFVNGTSTYTTTTVNVSRGLTKSQCITAP